MDPLRVEYHIRTLDGLIASNGHHTLSIQQLFEKTKDATKAARLLFALFGVVNNDKITPLLQAYRQPYEMEFQRISAIFQEYTTQYVAHLIEKRPFTPDKNSFLGRQPKTEGPEDLVLHIALTLQDFLYLYHPTPLRCFHDLQLRKIEIDPRYEEEAGMRSFYERKLKKLYLFSIGFLYGILEENDTHVTEKTRNLDAK